MSADLDVLLRWERSGGAWRVEGSGPRWAHVALLSCDGGEPMAQLWTREPDVLAYLEVTRP